MNTQLNMSTSFTLNHVEIAMLSFVNVLFSFIGSLGNSFVCCSFVIFPKLRNTMNVFIFSLAVSDLLVCLVAQPMFVASLLKSYQQQRATNTFEAVRKALTWVSLLASVGNLVGVTIDRYIAIACPFKYGNSDGINRNACLFLAAVWATAISLGIGTEFKREAKIIGQLYVFLAVFCFILPLYVRVWYIVRKHKRSILAIAIYVRRINDLKHSEVGVLRRRPEDQVYHGVLTVGLISALFVIGWFPLLILPFIYRSNLIHQKLVLSVFQWVNTLALCSSAINPIVYSWTDRKFRRSLQMVYKRWMTKRLVEVELDNG